MKVQITEIDFDCSLDDSDWSESDQVTTEERLSQVMWDNFGKQMMKKI